MLIIGITGPTGAGKTTFLSAIERQGGVGIDCDALYYELLRKDETLRRKLTDAFGAVFLPDGSLDRHTLGEIIFSNEEKLKTLNAIVFPAVHEAVLAKLETARRENVSLVGVDAINLLQSGIGQLCDLTVAVVADEKRRHSRIRARDGLTEAYAAARINAQENDAFFSKNCTKTLKNDYATEAEFSAVCDEYLETIIKEYEP